MLQKTRLFSTLAITTIGLSMLAPITVEAHCDTPSGPTYAALQSAIEENNFAQISYWVLPENEEELEETFNKAMSVMDKSDDEEIDRLAHDYLFENFVRLHREGEGAPYTGISDELVEEGIALADQSIVEETLQPLEDAGYVDDENKAHVEEIFQTLLERKDFDISDTKAGRAYVESYVEFTHLFEEGHGDAHHDANE